MDKFVIDLVKRDGSAILPEFGALSVVDESTGELMFNEYLKFNDGKLVQLIVAHSSMDEQEAQNAVAKYVREIKIDIDKGDSYAIFGAGSFSKDSDGAVVFSGSLSGSSASASDVILGPSPTPTATAEPVIIPTETTEAEPTPIDEPEAPIDQEDPAIVAVATDTPPPKEQPIAQPKQAKQASPRKKRGVLFYILLLLLVLVGAGGLFVGLNYDDVKSYFGWDKFDETQPVTQLQENEVTPSVITDEMEENTIEEVEEDPFIGEVESIEAVEEVVAPAPEAKVAPVTSVPTPSPQPADRSGQPYHLIGGSFTEKGNADNFVRDMQSKGYASHIVGEFNGMHMVSVKSFATREAAMNELSTIQNDAPKAWLFKHPK